MRLLKKSRWLQIKIRKPPVHLTYKKINVMQLNYEVGALDVSSYHLEGCRGVVSEIADRLSVSAEEYVACTEETTAMAEEIMDAITNMNTESITVDKLAKELKKSIT